MDGMQSQQRYWVHRLVVGLSLGLAVSLGTVVPGAAATASTLTGQRLDGSSASGNTSPCPPRGGGPYATWNVSGTATGPYAGTFTETGRFIDTDDDHIVTATFTITSTTTTVTGSWTGRPTQQGDFIGGCGGVDVAHFQAAPYTAVIHTPGGNFHDEGMANVTVDIRGPEDNSAATVTHIFTSSLTQPVPDTTPPLVTLTLPPPSHGTNGWYNGRDVTSGALDGAVTANDTGRGDSKITTLSCSGPTTGQISGLNTPLASASLTVTGQGSTNLTCSATESSNNTGSAAATVKIDRDPPRVNCAAPDSAWHATDVFLACTVSDTTSGPNPSDSTFQLQTSVAPGTETASAATGSRSVADVAGNTTTAGPIGGNKVDRKAPSISLSQPAAGPYLLNQSVAASYTCSDGGSGVATCAGPVGSGARIDTSSVGTKTFSVTASDVVGNTRSVSVSYTVTHRFSGFLAPVDNPPTVNTGKAGKTYPVKFQLSDASGAFVSDLSAVKSITVKASACGAFSSGGGDALEAEVTGATGLRYDSTANQYVYTWATPSKPGCYTLSLTLASGEVFPAYFNLS